MTGGGAARGAPPERPLAAVYFDCDSTLSAIEGIDELLEFAPASLRADILQLTQRAMEGAMPLAEVYETRLRRLAPRREQLERVGALYAARPTPHVREVVAALRALGKVVGVVSGGLLVPVRHFAETLGIDPAHVHAVPLQFAEDGAYRDFDRACPLWRNGGKVELLNSLPPEHHPMAFVGDGATDLEVQGTAAARFIGYGGVAVRDRVKQQAECWFETASMAPLLPLVLTADELAELRRRPEFAALLSAADA